jgi:hypothetical protein
MYSGASTDTPSLPVKTLNENAKVAILGEAADFFYVEAGGEKGFVLKSRVAYIEMRTSHITMPENGIGNITVRVFNDTSAKERLKWSVAGKIASIGKGANAGSGGSGGERYQDIRYTAAAKKVGIGYATVTAPHLLASCKVAIYSNVTSTSGNVKSKTPLYSYPGGGKAGSAKKGGAITVIGKSGGWLYVERNGEKYWAPAKKIIYIALSPKSQTVKRYHLANIGVSLHGSKATDKIQISVSPSDIAGTYYNGKDKISFYARGTGTAHITAAYKKAETSASISVGPVEISGLPSKLKMFFGEEHTLYARVADVPGASISWKSYNTKVATVKNGKIKAAAEGRTTVTASYKDLKKDITVEVVDIWGPTSPFVDVFFERDNKQGIWYSSVDAPQYWGGYNDLVDWVFDAGESINSVVEGLNTRNDKWVRYFTYDDYNGNKKEWRIEGWKGEYLNMGYGAEVGLYYRNPESWIKHYQTVDRGKKGKGGDYGDMMEMQFKLYDRTPGYNGLLLERGPEYHWWLNGFKPGVDHRIKLDDLEMAPFKMSFRSHTMANMFLNNYIDHSGDKVDFFLSAAGSKEVYFSSWR